MIAVVSPDDVSRIVADPPAGSTATPVPTTDVSRIVTTPSSTPTTIGDALKSLLTGVGRGVLESPGAAGDIANLAQLGVGKLAAPIDRMSPWLAALDAHNGTSPEASMDMARKGLAGQNGFDFSSASFAKLLDDAGILTYKPKGDAAKSLYNVSHFAGSVPAMGLTGIVGAGVKEGAGAAAQTAAKDLAVGTASGVGAEGGRGVANGLGVGEDSPWTRALLEGGGALLTGGGLGALLNRTGLLADTRPDILKDMDTAGVKPRFPSDITTSPVTGEAKSGGLFDGLLNSWLPNRYGARSISQGSAAKTQQELSNYTQAVLDGDTMPKIDVPGMGKFNVGNIDNQYPQAIGSDIKTAAEQSIEKLRAETTAAYTKLDAAIPADTPVVPTQAGKIIKDFNVSNKSSVQDALGSSVYDLFNKALSEPTLTWREMTALRQKIGGMVNQPGSLNGSDVGMLQQLYKALTGDMQSGAAATKDGLELFNKAIETAKNNGELIDGLTTNVIKAETPEMAPNWLLGQSSIGPTRINRFMDHVTPDQQDDLGRRLLMMAGTDKAGNFDLDQLMKFWKTRDPYAQDMLTTQPEISEGMDRASRIYNATTPSRALATQPNHSLDPVAMAATGFGGMLGAAHAATGHGIGPAALTAGILAAEPAVMSGAAGLAQRTGMVGRGPQLGNTTMAMPSNIFPDIFHPTQQPAPLPPGADLATADRPSAVAHIASKLGPRVAEQIPQDDTGFRAALANLYADPASRKALLGDQ